ncbi:MAG: transposase, partial [Coriobacteriales bacterium]|nr:transposase [Coriobacteriales bacterium]
MSKHEPYYSAKAFIGFDVHKRSIFACALIQETGELREKSFSGNGYEEVSSWIKSFADSASAVYEAGPFGFSLARFLNSQGIRCVVTHSNTLWASNPRRNKTDKEDARELARILSVGYVKPIYIPTEGEEARRSLCKERMHQVQAKGDIQRRILSFLDRHGMGESVDFSKWCEPYVDWLDSISFVSQEDTVLLSSLLSMREEIIRSLKGIDSQIEVIVSTNEDMQLLGRVYGIGNVTAFTIAAEAINLHRFKSSKAYASYF